MAKALAEKPCIWAVSSADTAQIQGSLRNHHAVVLPEKGAKLGQGFARRTLNLGRFERQAWSSLMGLCWASCCYYYDYYDCYYIWYFYACDIEPIESNGAISNRSYRNISNRSCRNKPLGLRQIRQKIPKRSYRNRLRPTRKSIEPIERIVSKVSKPIEPN